MLKSLNGLYRDRLAKFEEGKHPRDKNGKFSSGGEGAEPAKAVVSSADAKQHFDIKPGTMIERTKPLTMKSKVDGKTYTIHSQGSGAYRVSELKVSPQRQSSYDATRRQSKLREAAQRLANEPVS